jgi:hypothetical protein
MFQPQRQDIFLAQPPEEAIKEMGKIVNVRSLTFFTVLLVGLFFLYPVGANAQGPIKIGIVDTYSGPATTYTYDVRDAFKLAMEQVSLWRLSISSHFMGESSKFPRCWGRC